MKASAKLLGPKFVWPGLRKDVRAWAAVCVACQRAKVTRDTKAPLERGFDHVNVDLVGPLSPSRGYTYLLTMVDRTTSWPEVVPLSSTTAGGRSSTSELDCGRRGPGGEGPLYHSL